MMRHEFLFVAILPGIALAGRQHRRADFQLEYSTNGGSTFTGARS